MTTTNHSGCGGTILTGGAGAEEHEYCDRCGAFRYSSDEDDDFPTGADRRANREAWDNGDERSPEETKS